MSEAVRFRRPWHWLVVLVVVAAACIAAGMSYARERADQNVRQFRTAQALRLTVLKRDVDDLFGDAVQVASSGAGICSRIPPNAQLASRITREIYQSVLIRRIYGTGVFFVPGAFGTQGEYVSVYVRRRDAQVPWTRGDRSFSDGVEVDLQSTDPRPADDYARDGWFQTALAARGQTIVLGPYKYDRRAFITIEDGFDRSDRAGGVFVVDLLEADFLALMRRALVAGDVAAIVGADGRVDLTTGPTALRSPDRLTAIARIEFATHAHIVLSSDASGLLRRQREIVIGTMALVLAICLVAVLMGAGLIQRWRARERALELEEQRRRLEREIDVAHSVERELRRAAYTDALTGLPNRNAFLEYVQSVLGTDRTHGMMFIGVDRFNVVNETLGHLAGDEFLREIGARLEVLIADEDIVARQSGDEFALIGPLAGRRPIEELAQLVIAHVGQPLTIKGRFFYPEVSIGVVTIDSSYTRADEVLRDADIAMVEAKRRGRGRYVVFDAEMRQRVANDSELETALRRALERKELVPFYQPVVGVRSGEIVGFEALVRWNRGETVVSASEFMPFAEQRGLAAAIDGSMLQDVFQQCGAIQELFPRAKIAVNVSAPEFASPSLIDVVQTLHERHGCPQTRFEFEITETAMMTSADGALRTMERLRQIGIDLILDDFGTGYSSLAYLQQLPIKGIKIDRSFIEPLVYDFKALELVRSVVLLARAFELSTTVEGVETAEQWEIVRNLGVDFAQGFFFSPALAMTALPRLTKSILGRFAVE